MTHLGSRVSALVDAQLSPAAAERALAHVAGCAQCAAELAAARAARRALAGADDMVPTPDLTARLLSLAGEAYRAVPEVHEDPFAAPVAHRATARGTDPFVVPGRLSAHALTGDVTGRRSSRWRAAGSFASLGAVAVALFVMGDSPWVVPSGQSSQALALLGQATPLPIDRGIAPRVVAGAGVVPVADTDQAATAPIDYLAWMREHGWACPTRLPDGWTVTAVRFIADGALEVDVAGADGRLVVTERRGRLNIAALAGAEQALLGDHTVYVLSPSPWHAAWQSDDTVIEVVAADPNRAVAALVAGFPTGGYDDGVPARITRGWGTVTQAILQQ